jgi:4-methylaminobutanoate oxidase (formaldehyde-forming)
MASDFPTQARVVIIGGGVGGCSIAYHLAKMGWTEVVLLERGELTCGSTWHSAGLVGQLRSDFNLTRMMKYSTDLYRTLKYETGIDPGWREVGGLRLASSPERLVELKRQVGFARSFGMPLELISTEQAQRMWPLMNPEGVLGAVFTPTDGGIDPTGLTNALAAGAKKHGARLFTETTVSGIVTKEGGVDRVVTDRGSIRTEVVVNAAGMWANGIARMVGLRLPLIPFAHLYLITKPIEGLDHDVPTMRDPDHLVYWREEVGGLVTGGYERNPQPFGLDGIPDDFRYKLLPPDWERFTPLMENSIHRVPAVEKRRSSSCSTARRLSRPTASSCSARPTCAGFGWRAPSAPMAWRAPAASAKRWPSGSSRGRRSGTAGASTYAVSARTMSARDTR